MYQCPGCGGRLVFDIPSQQLMCDHCGTKYDPYAIGKEQDAEEVRNMTLLYSNVRTVVERY